MQRDRVWEDINPAQRAALSALPNGDDPDNPTPEQVAFRARVERERLQEENFAQGDIARAVGTIETGTGAQRRVAEELAEKAGKERKNKSDRAILLAALEAEIKALEHQIGIGQAFADDLANGILPELDEDGRIADDEREAFIQDYERRTGETVDRTDPEALLRAVNAQNQYLDAERQVRAEQRAEINRSDPSYSADQEADTFIEQASLYREQESIQSHGETSDTAESDHVQQFRTVEEEISHFMQELARAQTLENDQERLSAEHALVSALSEDAASFVSMDEDAERLFEETYFASLETPADTVRHDAPSPAEPTSSI